MLRVAYEDTQYGRDVLFSFALEGHAVTTRRERGTHVLKNPVAARKRTVTRMLNLAFSNGGGTVLIDGMPGMGKTSVLREFAQQARERGTWPVTYLDADELESGEPFSFMERFWLSGLAPDWSLQHEEDLQPIKIAREFMRVLLEAAAQDGGHVIIIDDIQWIDAESVRVLRYMIPRVVRQNVLIVCGERTPRESSIGELLADAAVANPHDQHLTIEPLTEHEIRALAAERFGVSISPRNAAELRELTGGTFLGVDSVFAQVTDEEISQLHRSWSLPLRRINLENPLLAGYQQLSPEAQRVAQVVSLAHHEVSPELLCTAVNKLNLPDKTGEAIEAGVLIETNFGRSIVPKHSLIAAAVRNTVDPPFAREVYRVLSTLTEGFVSIRHLFLSAEAWNDELEQRLEEYLPEALRLNHYRNATEILRMALDLAVAPADREQRITDLVLLNVRAKREYLCLDLLPEIETFPPSMLREFMALMLRTHLLHEPLPTDRMLAALQATPSSPDETMLQAYLAFMRVWTRMRQQNEHDARDLIADAKDRFQRGPQRPEELTDARIAWMAVPEERLLLLDCYELVQWHHEGNIQQLKQALPETLQKVSALPDIPIKIDCLVPLTSAAMATGNVLLAHDVATEAVELLDRVSGEPWAGSTPYVVLAHASLLLGRYKQSESALEELDKVSHETLDLEARLTGAALQASLTAITEDDDPSPYVSLAQRVRELGWELYGRDLAIMAEAEIARIGQDAQGVEEITSAPETERISNTQRGFLTYRAHALIKLNRIDEAQELVDELLERRGNTWFEYWGTLDWLQARLAQATERPGAAKELYMSALDERQYPLPWALTAVDYGNFLREQGQVDEAEHILGEAVAMMEKIGAKAYLPVAREQLDTAQSQNRAEQASMISDLTDREREVAELLAQGRTNRDIAERLVVSQATARFHVSNILRKLQVSSRSEVPALFHDAGWPHTSGQSTTK